MSAEEMDEGTGPTLVSQSRVGQPLESSVLDGALSYQVRNGVPPVKEPVLTNADEQDGGEVQAMNDTKTKSLRLFVQTLAAAYPIVTDEIEPIVCGFNVSGPSVEACQSRLAEEITRRLQSGEPIPPPVTGKRTWVLPVHLEQTRSGSIAAFIPTLQGVCLIAETAAAAYRLAAQSAVDVVGFILRDERLRRPPAEFTGGVISWPSVAVVVETRPLGCIAPGSRGAPQH